MTYYPIVNADADIASGVNIDPAKINLATGTYSIDAANLTGTVNVARLAGITTSQMATAAGIVDGQLATGISASKISGALSGASIAASAITGTPFTKGQQVAATAYTDAANTFAPTVTGGGAYQLNPALAVTPTINQSGTAGYTGLQVQVTETATGSGSKYPIDVRIVGTGSVFSVDNTGKIATGSADAALLTSGTVALGRLSGITTTQLSGSAGITSGQIASVASSTLTGTIPAAWLGATSTTATAGNDSRLSDTRTPTAASVVDASVSATAAIAESKLSLASDAAAGTASRRTIGTGALQAAAGNDSRLSDARTPTAHASTHEYGGSDPVLYDMGHGNTTSISVIDRENGPHDIPTINAGTLYVTYFTAPRSLTVNQMIVALGAVFATATYVEFALYTVAADSALTMVRRSGNLSATAITAQTTPTSTASVTGFVTAPGLYPIPLNKDSANAAASNYAIVRGTRYAIGIVGNATTVGKFNGMAAATGASLIWYNSGTFGGIANLFNPIMAKQFANTYTSAAPIPTSHTGSTGSASGNRHWALLAG